MLHGNNSSKQYILNVKMETFLGFDRVPLLGFMDVFYGPSPAIMI